MNEKYILILGGEYPLRERVLAGAMRASNNLPIVTIAKNRISSLVKFFDDTIVADVASPTEVLQAVRKYEVEKNRVPAAVIPMNDFNVRTGLHIATHYGLLYNSAQTIENCRDKFLMKQVLQAHHLPVPRFARFKTKEELMRLIKPFRFPVVLKPSEFAGSVGVIKVEQFENLIEVFDQCMRDVRALSKTYHVKDEVFQVEEYIECHQEMSIEVINFRGFRQVLAITDKYLGPEPYFVETGHSVPSFYSEDPRIRDIALTACKALGIEYGMAHVELRLTPSGEIYLIEVGARTGGDAIMDLIEQTYGINPYELYVQTLLGKKPQIPETLVPNGLAAVAFLKAKPGEITQIRIPKDLPSQVRNLQIWAKPGDQSYASTSWRAREGSLELFWENKKPIPCMTEHLEFARELSEHMFEGGL